MFIKITIIGLMTLNTIVNYNTYLPNSIYFISKSYTYILNIWTKIQLLMRLKSKLYNIVFLFKNYE